MTNDETKGHLEAIAAAHGGTLRPEDVGKAARAADHPLHSRFEWDNAKAAEAHRLDQARSLIRSVKVTISTTTRNLSVCWFAHDPMLPPGEQGYVSQVKIRSSEEIARAAVASEFQRVASALERLRDQALAAGMGGEAALADRMLGEIAATVRVEESEEKRAAG